MLAVCVIAYDYVYYSLINYEGIIKGLSRGECGDLRSLCSTSNITLYK